MALSDDQIDAVITAGVKSGAISWIGFKKDDEGRHTLPVISLSDRQQARAIEAEVRKDDEGLIRKMLDHIERNTCTHKSTHRGGAIWEICDDCDAKWADDQGGKPKFKWPAVVISARARLEGRP